MAKGTLFGGYRVWVPDEQGNPLHAGRASFYVAGSSTPANVYKDKNLNVAWGTSVPIDSHGFIGNSEDGVWLSREHLYKVVIERRICDDPITWEVVTTTNNVGEVEEVEAEPANPYERYTVAIISNLKDILPTVYNVVYVNGWFSEGDCGEPMQFRWRSGKSVSSDDGHWIKSNTVYASNGCWEQIFEDGDIDVRKFGAIPDTDRACDTYIRNALLFATEPHVYTTGDPKREPRTIKFVKEGYYKLSNSLDLNSYKMNTNNGSMKVPVVIYGGVCFKSENVAAFTPSETTTILSGDTVVSGNLRFVANKIGYVNPNWFSTLYSIGKNLIVVPEGYSSDFKSLDKVVLNLNEGSVYAKYLYSGDLKIVDDAIYIGDSKYVDFGNGKAEFIVNATMRSVSANEFVSERGTAKSKVDYSGVEITDSSSEDSTLITYEGIVAKNGGFKAVSATNKVTTVGLEATNAIVDVLKSSHTSVCTFYPDGSGTGGETDAALEDSKNIPRGSIAIACNTSSNNLVISLPGKSGSITIPSNKAVIFVSNGPKTYTKNVLVESYEDATEGVVATYREEEVTVPDWYRVST